MRKMRGAAVAGVAMLAFTVAVSVGSARDSRSAAASKNCAFTLRIGDVLPFTGDLAAYGANLDRAVKVGGRPPERGAQGGRPLEVDPGHARRIGGRADAGERVGRGGDEARQVEQGQRADRRDGLERDDPDGPVGGDPEQDRPDLPHLERAAADGHQGQRLPLAGLSVRHAAGQGARAGRDRRVRRRSDPQRRRAQRRVRHGAEAALRRASTRSSAARSARTSRGTRRRRTSTPRRSSWSTAARRAG